MNKFKIELISFAQTFGATFLTTVGILISNIPTESLNNPTTYTHSFVFGIVMAGARTAFKIAWQKFLPVSMGGVRD